jgi:prepilin-type N-terminal cleavage/methylation domain-containing protein
MADFRVQKGFSLVELAIVLGILGLVFVAGLKGVGSFHHSANTSESQENLAEIKKQVLNFSVINKSLPCPDTDGDGLENRASVSTSNGTIQKCTADVGGVPYLDLGLREEDADDGWGNAIRYAVNTESTDANLICDKTRAASMFCNQGASSRVYWFTLEDTPPFASNRGAGNYYVCNNQATSCSGTPSSLNLESDTASVVLVAYNEDGAKTLSNCASETGANQENCDTDLYYHKKQRTTESGQFFDDVIVTISGHEVKAQMASGTISWNSYNGVTSGSGPLVPTYETFDISTDADVDAAATSGKDVVFVNRNVTKNLDLKNGDDYIAIGNNLEKTLDAGNGDDTVYIVGAAIGSVSLGNGNDSFVLGTNLTDSLDAGSGADKVWIQGEIRSGSTVVLGDGDDILWLGLNTEPYDNSAIESTIETGPDTGASDYDILVLENVPSWNDLSTSDQAHVTGFDLIIFADDGSGNRDHCVVANGC